MDGLILSGAAAIDSLCRSLLNYVLKSYVSQHYFANEDINVQLHTWSSF